MTAPMVDYKIHWLKMMSVPESRAVVGRHDGINGRDRLETVAADAPLTFLDHHLQCGDSLMSVTINRLNSLPGDEGLLKGQFTREVEAALPALLEPLAAISDIPSDTAEHVKDKERIYKRRFLPALRRFSAVSDLWTAEAMRGGLIRPGQYEQALGALGIERRFSEVVESHWAQAAFALLAGKAVVPFNWELAFPHVFLAHTQRGQTGSGFDVVLGNPPYDVLSEKESGQNIDHIKRFIEIDPQLTPARVGKNNLYKLFIARSVNLLAEGGYFTRISQVASIFSAARRRFCYKNHEVVACMERWIWHTRWVNRNRGAFGSILTVD